jgi:hypothetical protein
VSFQYTSGDPTHLTGGGGASMADVQGPFTDLKTFLNARIAAIPTLVSSLPVSPVDAQEIHYLADATNGIVWHLRYRSASASSFKWECVGGRPLWAQVATAENTGSASYVDLTTVGPSVTLPLAGDYDIGFSAALSPDSANRRAIASVKLGAAATSDTEAMINFSAVGGMEEYAARPNMRRTGLAAAAALKMQYRSDSAGFTATFAKRELWAIPVRVG